MLRFPDGLVEAKIRVVLSMHAGIEIDLADNVGVDYYEIQRPVQA